MGEMEVRKLRRNSAQRGSVACLGFALVTHTLRLWPQALPLGTCCARIPGFRGLPLLCLGDSRAALLASGSALRDLLHSCPQPTIVALALP
jgi:hypothetical protein